MITIDRLSFPRQERAIEPNCIICVNDAGYLIIGPFDDPDELSLAGARWQEANGDDPRWQALRLGNPWALPHVLSPSVLLG